MDVLVVVVVVLSGPPSACAKGVLPHPTMNRHSSMVRTIRAHDHFGQDVMEVSPSKTFAVNPENMGMSRLIVAIFCSSGSKFFSFKDTQ